MAPFSKAIRTMRKEAVDHIFLGNLDKEWTVIGSPHGGATLALMADAMRQFQVASHPDLASLSATFLGPSTPGPVEVHLTLLRRSKRWSNLSAELFQNVSMP